MSKKLIAALVLLVALVAIYLATRPEPHRIVEDAQWSIAGVEALHKLEISDGKLRLVFERGEDGTWRQVEPVEAPAAAELFDKVDELFAAGIEADLTSSKGADLSEYALSGEGVATVRAFVDGEALAEFAVGKAITVPNSNARRTWVLPDGFDVAYRAYTTAENIDLAAVLGRDPQDWREKKVLGVAREDLVEVTISGGTQTIRLVKDPQAEPEEGQPKTPAKWRISEPTGVALDQGRVSSMTSTLANFAVDGFADGVPPAKSGLDWPWRSVTLVTPDKEAVLEFGGRVADGPDSDSAPDDDARYLHIAGEPFVYVVGGAKVANLTRSLGELRDKTVLSLTRDAIVGIAISGAEPYTLTRAAEGWKLTAAEAEVPVEDTKLAALLSSLSSLRALDYPEVVDAAVTGLDSPDAFRATVTLADGTAHVITLGSKVSPDKEDVFARVDSGLVFSLSSYAAGHLRKLASDYSGS